MKPVLCIGDVHGHFDRLAFLLQQEDILDENEVRVNRDVEVIQLGDLGHFGGSTGSPTGDYLCYQQVADNDWVDIVCWGNHDAAVRWGMHAFRGYESPGRRVEVLMDALEEQGRLVWAVARHGHLLTHAGLGGAFKQNHPPIDKTDPYDVAQWLNGYLTDEAEDKDLAGCRHAIGYRRGGYSHGGVIWRDITEKLWDKFPQVFGHSADHKRHDVRYCWGTGFTSKIDKVPDHVENVSYCIDIGGKGGPEYPEGNCLMGMWLPEGKIVRVDLGERP